MSPDRVIACYATTPDLPGSNQQLEPTPTFPNVPYRLVSLDIGEISYRRMTAESPYQHGRFLVGAVRDVMTTQLEIRAYGSSASDLDANVATLLATFGQFSYEVDLTIDGVHRRWRCEVANVRQNDGRGLDKFALSSFQQVYTFEFPRDPIPVAGSM